jgi:hypothetical protein
MTATFRKFILTAHVATSVGWFGALAVFLAHAIVSSISRDEQIVRAMAVAMSITTWLVVLPLGLASLTTGLVQALGTAWGLFRHYWVVFKLLFSTVATIVLLLKLEPISYLAEAATRTTFFSADFAGLRTSLVVHAVGGLMVLLTVTALAIFKPQGLTPYGIRKHRERGSVDGGSGFELVTRTPRWVKVLGAVLATLMLMFAVMLHGGGHGPGTHISDNRLTARGTCLT